MTDTEGERRTMGIFDGVLFCSDFDGTLAYKGVISKENAEAIRYFQSEGGIFSPCSGRRAHFFHRFSELFRPNGPVIVLNGGVIMQYGETPEEDRVLYESEMPTELVRDCTKRLLHVPGVRCAWMHRVEGPDKFFPDTAHSADALIDCAEGPFCKILVTHEPEAIGAMREAVEPRYGDRLFFSSSAADIYEVLLIGADKGSSALRVKEMVGAHTLVCAGDYGNDIPMLRVADIAYATGNASDDAKAAAHRVTVPCTEHAIARIVEELRAEFA